MAAKKGGLGKGLGKGLNNLIREDVKPVETPVPETKIVEKIVKQPEEIRLKLSSIEPNREQPRKNFNEDALIELSESIKQYGVVEPLLVQKKGDYYEIIAGERRWRAAKMAGVKDVPVVIRDYSPQEIVEVSLIENIQREDLNPIEEALAYQRLSKDFNLKQDEIAERVSKSRATVANAMRLLKLDKRVQQMIIDDMISSGHARCLIGIEDGEQQYMVAQNIFDNKLSVRETEQLIKKLNAPEKPIKENKENDFVYRDWENKLKDKMKTKVVIKNRDNNKGKIEIDYYSKEDLERIIYMLQSVKE